ncbi:MAG: RNA-directed DNA polymerase [Candidatus Marinimicrobia bacterium]|nr:RNA-directed DNA polymerase [Candidatus Neomarinimicrobiota bacterium]
MAKHYRNFYEKIISIENLKLAYYKSVRGKRLKNEVLLYTKNLDNNLAKLQLALIDGYPPIGHYHYFKIYDPKKREICAASFSERILHHAIMNICDPAFEKMQIYDSYACRKNKGTDRAVLRAFHFSKHYKYFLKLDIVKYFNSVSHDILIQLLEKKFSDKRLNKIFNQIIGSYATEPGKGIPIGNLTSQYFANYYLGFLDHYIKNELRVKGYLRYMDDFVLFSDNIMILHNLAERIKLFCEEVLKLKMHSPYINSSCMGLPFLGFLIKAQGIYLSGKKKRRLQKKHKIYENWYIKGHLSEAELGVRVNALWAQTKLARTRNFAKLFDNEVLPRARTV